MKTKSLIAVLALASVSIISCQKVDVNPIENVNQPAIKETPDGNKANFANYCQPTEAKLLSDLNENVGSVVVTNDMSNIYITYNSTDEWTLSQTHLYVGDIALMPVGLDGTPDLANFPYTGSHNDVKTYTFQVPVSLIQPGTCGSIVAHTIVQKTDDVSNQTELRSAFGKVVQVKTNGIPGFSFVYCSCMP